ncbi:MAG: PrsW family intramembrane metalloprotease [Candidatus Harrisonbacteria bacterium]|nr:PrsW family intramembrane metalloprotease [Candidatus Harrisonbacteria bacterium]
MVTMAYLPLILGILPSFAWLFFYMEEDPHPEPKKLIFETFLAGAISTFIVLAFQNAFNNWAAPRGIAQYSLLSFLVLGAIEELFKFGSARLVTKEHQKDFDEPVDAMIYIIVAALGFSAVENIAAASNAQQAAFETTTLRFIGATLLHTLSSGLLGYYWARSLLENKRNILFTGFALATLLHAVFNYLIIRFEPVIIPTTFLIIFALFILYDFEKLKRVEDR